MKLFRYCECFQANIVCTERCRCSECKNFTNSSFREKALQKLAEAKIEENNVVIPEKEKQPLDSATVMSYFMADTAALYEKLVGQVFQQFVFS